MFRNRHNGGSCGLSFKGEVTRTQQHLKKFTDVNFMMERALAGDTSVYRRGFSADISRLPDDMQSVLNVQIRARESYEALPDAVRKQYPTPELFFAACNDPEQKDNLAKLGLLKPEVVTSPVEVKIVNPESVNKETNSEAHA